MRLFYALVLSALISTVALAQEAAPQPATMPWRLSVSAQIEAFRSGDAEGALAMAGAVFQATYDDAERFLADVETAGYGPIVASRSHSFGDFRQISDTRVVQIVNLVGPDQRLYEAVYELANEEGDGWRVQGVIMRETQGMGI